MREVLFRGKRIDNGEWVEGFLLKECNYATCSWNLGIEYKTDRFGRFAYEVAEVNPETVGQFTGLTDKNGKKIFEGDIVKAKRICNGNSWTGCVVWWHGCFALQGIKDSNNVPAIDLFRNYEVIGNIHDNPELLETA